MTSQEFGMSTPQPAVFEVTAEGARSPDAALLIAALSAELARRYDHVDDGSGNFRPEDATVAGSAFLIGRLDEHRRIDAWDICVGNPWSVCFEKQLG
jgi:hypothetical protein